MAKKDSIIVNENNYRNADIDEMKDYYQIEEKFYEEDIRNNEKKIQQKNTRKINKR